MAHGFAIFDRQFHLVLWNVSSRAWPRRRGAEAGPSLTDFLMAGGEAGHFPGRIASESGPPAAASPSPPPNRPSAHEAFPARGRSRGELSADARPLLLATHEDITEQKRPPQRPEAAREPLERQNMRFTAAVDNMSQGLCMFDREQKLVICNKRYADIYGLPPRAGEARAPRCAEILRQPHRAAASIPGRPAGYIQRRIELVTNAKEDADTIELQDGRVISILHHPMSDGGWVSTHQDITEQRRNEARIRHLARHDALTDLPNRMLFRERMEAAEARIRRGEDGGPLRRPRPLQGGQRHARPRRRRRGALGRRRAPQCLPRRRHRRPPRRRRVRHPARAPRQPGRRRHRRPHRQGDGRALRHRRPPHPDRRQRRHRRRPGDGSDAETLMKNADLALYRAKAEGRGAYHFFEKGMDAALQERRALEIGPAPRPGQRRAAAGLPAALGPRGKPHLRPRGAAALGPSRARHHPAGRIHPDRRGDRPDRADRRMGAARGLRAATAWPADVRVAVNLSPVQFKNRNLVDHVVSALATPASAADAARTRDHRVAAPRRERADAADPAPAARPRRAHLDGRFRHRLFLAELPALLPLRQDQDRPLLRPRSVAAPATASPSSRR